MGRAVLISDRVTIALILLAAALTAVVDQLSKAAVRASIQPGESIPVVDGLFHLTHVRNTGAAFGLIPGGQAVFIAVAVLVLLGVAVYAWRAPMVTRTAAIALGLVAGGAIGNLIDRVDTGRVTDFLDFQVWPVFNVADSAIFVGTGALVLWTLLASRDEIGDRSDTVADA